MMDGNRTGSADRQDWMGTLARAPAADLVRYWDALGLDPAFAWLRPPETGTVMVQGRAGGTGAPFNLGEMTVTRASLRLETGEVGHAWVQGRDRAKARIAALADALMQTDAADRVRAGVIAPLAAAEAARRATRARKAAATKVEFFTMVRGE
ncbi:MAG: phosphonate C-P lyase system protein PhnG [Rhodobacteraceae bacterium]|jgi:alpha-D-ribose 1-methylphosphonate 5-triphosphate synthase subunit PhnG|nr:phosphonate C-P lyase system protein PhnG [Paracoccaceae bacterium]